MFGRCRSWNELTGDDLADQVVLHVAAHAADDRDDRDQERHADRHADHREEALELLHTDGVEGEENGLEEGHERETGWRGRRLQMRSGALARAASKLRSGSLSRRTRGSEPPGYMPESGGEDFSAFVGRDQAVAEHDDAARVRGDVGLVGDHDDRLALTRRGSRTRA